MSFLVREKCSFLWRTFKTNSIEEKKIMFNGEYGEGKDCGKVTSGNCVRNMQTPI